MAPKPLRKGGEGGTSKDGGEQGKAKAQQKDEELVLTLMLQKNTMALGYVRTYSGIMAGSVAGLCRAGGILGIIIFLLVSLAASGFVYLKVGGQVKKYFLKETDPLLSQAFGGLMTFLLTWIMVYDVVHLF
ncbi:unnamed protein product [Amoebophrya sp. A120]|nr:unnamed protein product [Amoebophrya sp. A120]|eukprot:GSA120T00017041001.1